ncbi:T9SS type A sorting domain-containing protein [Ferruginibacter albus]|uniref:hypothetical protein n=1 Tax=Ferruginibacter albus TaxID=2875540 RepID=UPI001CC3BA95|nr:hypothetical protein [Ferruginibacter albus]UAY52783.1 hypothetical protein K9M53_03655 [Ferruginibacter albus]
MKKFLLLLLLTWWLNGKAQFGISSSAIFLTVNGNSAFYNTQITGGSIGKISFGNNLGVFGTNTGNLKIAGAAITTFKNTAGNVCGGNLYYAVYPKNKRPVNPDFSIVPIAFFSSSGNNQKWQNFDNAIDLTNYALGNYTLEIYYSASANSSSGNCALQQMDNATGNNYTADFAIAQPLAITLTSFYGSDYSKGMQVRWSAQNDVDAVSYEIQKSDNGLNFSTIGTVSSKQSNGAVAYTFNDLQPMIGTNFYRIKINNNNGTVSLSHVIRLYFGTIGNSILIYPNPVGSVLTLRLAAVTKGNYRLSILSNIGQQITTQELMHDGVDKTLRINLPLIMPKGLYRVFLIDETHFYKQAFYVN